jgi:hypothetical protein
MQRGGGGYRGGEGRGIDIGRMISPQLHTVLSREASHVFIGLEKSGTRAKSIY